MGEATLGRNPAGLAKAQRVAGPAAGVAVHPVGRDGALPGGAVVAGNDDAHVRDVGGPGPKRVQPAQVLRDGLDVGVGPYDGGLEALLPEEPHRLQRAGTTAGVQGKRRHSASSSISMPRSVSRTWVHAGSRAISTTISTSPAHDAR